MRDDYGGMGNYDFIAIIYTIDIAEYQPFLTNPN
jgi:DNA-binding Lrp family transcriptional regulator